MKRDRPIGHKVHMLFWSNSSKQTSSDGYGRSRIGLLDFPTRRPVPKSQASSTQALSLTKLGYAVVFPASIVEFSASYSIMYISRTEDIMWRWHSPPRIPAGTAREVRPATGPLYPPSHRFTIVDACFWEYTGRHMENSLFKTS